MVSKRETRKRFIATALSHLPPYIAQYPSDEQKWLHAFLTVLRHYEVDTKATRQQFIEQWRQFQENLRANEAYLTLPFLWFALSYLTRATQLLDVALFHADDFYTYLATHLRGTDGLGVFPLVRKQVPLVDERWEQLQYASKKLIVPLTSEELEVLTILYDFSFNGGIEALSPRQLKAVVSSQTRTPLLVRRLPRICTRVDAHWAVVWHFPAFDLTQVYCRMEVGEHINTLSEILDCGDPTNTTLRGSNLYTVRNVERMYLGVLLVPSHLVMALQTYLEVCQEQGDLIVHEYEPVIERQHTSALADYKPNKGWQKWGVTACMKLVKELRPRKQRVRQARAAVYYTSFNDAWHYFELPRPTQAIPLLCREDLNTYTPYPGLAKNRIENDSPLLKTLHYHRVMVVVIFAHQLIREFTIPEYWLTLPRIPFAQLSHLLQRVPYTNVFRTKDHYHLWAPLNPYLGDWLERELGWAVRDIIPYHVRHSLAYDDYDFPAQEWKAPRVLEEE
ncbi:MAG: hypothetical protein JSV04_12090 [Candidatus Heimdallarchaeota archaeon]|nr:MAG: hypothetical protein JSV04_12090 [Candidatus Heimdallarchaeota archaeon]